MKLIVMYGSMTSYRVRIQTDNGDIYSGDFAEVLIDFKARKISRTRLSSKVISRDIIAVFDTYEDLLVDLFLVTNFEEGNVTNYEGYRFAISFCENYKELSEIYAFIKPEDI